MWLEVRMSNQAGHTIVRLRVPPELKKQIEESAEKNNRSQSAEMVARLEQSFNEVEHTFKIISKETTLKVSQEVIDEVIKIMQSSKPVSISLSEGQKNK